MHQHEWTENPHPMGSIDDWMCAECTETSATCIVTRLDRETGEEIVHASGSSLLICEDCLRSERHVLERIEAEALEIVPEQPVTISAYAYDSTGTSRADDRERLPFGLDVTVDDPDLGIPGIRTADGVAGELWGWVGLWSDASGDYQQVGAVEYLASHLVWAAHNPVLSHWHRYRAEVRRLLGRVRALVEAQDPQVERLGPACFDCGGDLVSEWRADGLGSEVRCASCRREYGPAQYRLAFRALMDRERDRSDDALVNEDEARQIIPGLPHGNLRTWAARGRIECRGRRQGRNVYRLGDIRALVDTPGAPVDIRHG